MHFCCFKWIGNLRRTLVMCSTLRKIRNTLIIICEDMWPPSEESKLPGSPADSQLEQMSIETQIAQWNRAPRISCRQLKFIRYCNHVTIGHLLCTLHAGMFHGYRHSGERRQGTIAENTHIVPHCCRLTSSSAKRVSILIHS